MRATGETGVQTHFQSLQRGLEDAGHEVTLVNSFSVLRWLACPIYAVRRIFLRGPFEAAGVGWYRYWHYVFLYFALRRLVLSEGVDVVSAQCPLSAQAALKVRRNTGRSFRVIWTCHFNESQAAEFAGRGQLRKGSRLYASIEKLEREMLQAVDGVTFVSEYSRQVTLNHAGVAPACSHVVFNGLQPPVPVSRLQRKDLGLRDDAFVIVNVGVLEPNKNQHAFVQMLADLLLAEENCQLLLVGDGPDRRKIETFVRDRGLRHKVLLAGFRTDVHEILPLCNLYCHPSKTESFGLAVAEAMSHGLPVIVAPVGGIPEFVEHERSGLLIACQDDRKGAYLEAIRRLMRNGRDRQRLAHGARQAFENRLTLQVMTAHYEEILAPLAG